MVKIGNKFLLGRATVLGLVLAFSAFLGGRTSIAWGVGMQAAPATTDTAKEFAGTWNWMLHGTRAVTLVLTPSGSGFTGSLTNIEGIQLDQDGTVLRIEPGDGTTPILSAALDGPVMHFKTKDGDDETEWTVTLKGSGNAEVRGRGPEGPAMKPIAAEKAR